MKLHSISSLPDSSYWETYLWNLGKFFKEVFHLTIPEIRIPQNPFGFNHLMVYPKNKLSTDKIFEISERFYKSSIWVDQSIAQIKNDPSRPKSPYFFYHVGSKEPDIKHCGKSYAHFQNEDALFMTIDEYLLARLFAYWQYGIIWDTECSTLTSSKVKGFVLSGEWVNNEVEIGAGVSNAPLVTSGPREIALFK